MWTVNLVKGLVLGRGHGRTRRGRGSREDGVFSPIVRRYLYKRVGRVRRLRTGTPKHAAGAKKSAVSEDSKYRMKEYLIISLPPSFAPNTEMKLE